MEKGIIEILQTEMLDFTAPVLINNLPALDGLLVSQRQVIWGMKKAGMTSDKQFYKMLKASGRIFDYYVLGDAPLCGVMKNMGNNYVLNKYLMPKGSFGNKNFKKSKGSAPRYIECKLDQYSEHMLEGINKGAVVMKSNYDATEKEPIILPSKIPNILTNLRMSIAVSESNKMPSHNVIDTCDSIISYIKTKDINKSIDIIQAPDLPSGGAIIYNEKDFEKIYKEGNGSFTQIGKYRYDSEKNKITIYEIPYSTYIENIEEELENKLDKFSKELIDYHNGSDKDGLKLELYLKKNANPNIVVQKLRKYTSFESKFSCNFVILDLDGKTPICMSLEQIITKWILHRQTCIRKELEFDYNKLSKKFHQLKGLEVILNDLDSAISIIRNSKNDNEAIENIKTTFNLDKDQAEYVVTIKLLNINKGFLANKISDLENIKKELHNISTILSSDNNINNIIIEQLEEVKTKFGQPRRTEIIYEDTIQEISQEQFIEDYSCQIVLSKGGYIKKNKKYSENQKLKEGDEVLSITQTTNAKGKIILISSLGTAYVIKCSDLVDKLPSEMGVYIPSIIDLQKDETIVGSLVTDNYSGYKIVVFDNGKIAKIPLLSYQTKANRKSLSNSLSLESKVINIYQINEDVEIELTDSFGKTKIINTKDINSKSKRDTIGVQAHKSVREGFKIVSSRILNSNS